MIPNRTTSLLLTILLFPVLYACGTNESDAGRPKSESETSRPPNLVIFYVDDLGYGDVGSYGAVGVETPSVDRLAAEGVRFTDAHSSAATCTPSRYSLLTGEHGFRSQAEILPGDAPALIRPGKPTLPAMLKRAGYTTAVVGKWHLGLGEGAVDWNTDVKPGPLEIGFDYSFLLPATGDRVPTVYLENHRVVDLDPADPIEVSYRKKVGNRSTGYENPELLRVKADRQHSDTIVNGVSRIGHMGGGESALWVDEEFPDVFTEKAVAFVRANKDRPFFLFHSFHDIHVPRLPNPRFAGKSTMGPRGDAIAQMDWIVGTLVKELEELGIAENTLVIFTSDNGPVLDDGYADQSVERLGEHKPWGPFRGGKYSSFEAGTRVPTITWWPGTVSAGESAALLSQVDIYASIAKLVGVDRAEDEAADSMNQLDAWLGRSARGRDLLLLESVGGLSLRDGNWKYIVPFSGKTLPDWLPAKGIEGGISPEPQLYDLGNDIREQLNLAPDRPNRVRDMQITVDRIVERGY
ncbi:MAG: arylsulfatase [Gammaproteobacteria bacterium]|nr:arylsulfatase [Gammaproteobacteria bacterium]